MWNKGLVGKSNGKNVDDTLVPNYEKYTSSSSTMHISPETTMHDAPPPSLSLRQTIEQGKAVNLHFADEDKGRPIYPLVIIGKGALLHHRRGRGRAGPFPTSVIEGRYLREFKAICDELAAIGKPISNQYKVFWLLNGLGSGYEEFVTSMLTRPPTMQYGEVVALLHAHETMRALHAEEAVTNHHSAFVVHQNQQPRTYNKNNRCHFNSAGRGFPQANNNMSRNSQNKGDPKKDKQYANPYKGMTCQIFNKPNHVALNCRHRFNQAFEAEDVPTALASLKISDGQDQTWFANTGASNHIMDNPVSQLTSDMPYPVMFDANGFVIKNQVNNKMVATGTRGLTYSPLSTNAGPPGPFPCSTVGVDVEHGEGGGPDTPTISLVDSSKEGLTVGGSTPSLSMEGGKGPTGPSHPFSLLPASCQTLSKFQPLRFHARSFSFKSASDSPDKAAVLLWLRASGENGCPIVYRHCRPLLFPQMVHGQKSSHRNLLYRRLLELRSEFLVKSIDYILLILKVPTLPLEMLQKKDRMEKTLDTIKANFNSVRTGRASPAILDRIEFYASMFLAMKTVSD
ncbi:Ribosome-recycling factor [Nymphaea thermarum]|nr:Ribosome-recycling factor [Nymphaea thermarum]